MRNQEYALSDWVWETSHRGNLVLATVPYLELAGFIGLCGNGLTTSKIDHMLSKLPHYVH
jgi:hypothetical protein